MRREPGSKVEGTVGVDRRADMTGEDQRIVQDLSLDVGARQQLAQHCIEWTGVLLDPNLEDEDLLAVGIEEKGVGAADLLADQVDPVRAVDDGVHEFGVGYDHVPQIAWQLDHNGLAQTVGVRVHHIGAYYSIPAQTKRLLDEGHSREAIGLHASVIDTSELMSVHPKGVDLARYRQQFFLPMEQSGVYGNPMKSTGPLGASLLRMRIEAATQEIKALERSANTKG